LAAMVEIIKTEYFMIVAIVLTNKTKQTKKQNKQKTRL
jgi:hypothetical protein